MRNLPTYIRLHVDLWGDVELECAACGARYAIGGTARSRELARTWSSWHLAYCKRADFLEFHAAPDDL